MIQNDLPAALHLWTYWAAHPQWQWPLTVLNGADPRLFGHKNFALPKAIHVDASRFESTPVVGGVDETLSHSTILSTPIFEQMFQRLALPQVRSFYAMPYRPLTRSIISMLHLLSVNANTVSSDQRQTLRSAALFLCKQIHVDLRLRLDYMFFQQIVGSFVDHSETLNQSVAALEWLHSLVNDALQDLKQSETISAAVLTPLVNQLAVNFHQITSTVTSSAAYLELLKQYITQLERLGGFALGLHRPDSVFRSIVMAQLVALISPPPRDVAADLFSSGEFTKILLCNITWRETITTTGESASRASPFRGKLKYVLTLWTRTAFYDSVYGKRGSVHHVARVLEVWCQCDKENQFLSTTRHVLRKCMLLHEIAISSLQHDSLQSSGVALFLATGLRLVKLMLACTSEHQASPDSNDKSELIMIKTLIIMLSRSVVAQGSGLGWEMKQAGLLQLLQAVGAPTRHLLSSTSHAQPHELSLPEASMWLPLVSALVRVKNVRAALILIFDVLPLLYSEHALAQSQWLPVMVCELLRGWHIEEAWSIVQHAAARNQGDAAFGSTVMHLARELCRIQAFALTLQGDRDRDPGAWLSFVEQTLPLFPVALSSDLIPRVASNLPFSWADVFRTSSVDSSDPSATLVRVQWLARNWSGAASADFFLQHSVIGGLLLIGDAAEALAQWDYYTNLPNASQPPPAVLEARFTLALLCLFVFCLGCFYYCLEKN